jgi:zona occludens toxin (predicted ATPase)
MIQIVTGKLGAGKTLYTVMMLFDALCSGRTVVTNIAVNWEEMVSLARRVKRVVLDPRQLIKIDPAADKNWHKHIPFGTDKGFVEVYLDEIHLFFNARDWAKTNTENKSLLSFLTQSRKARVNVTFIAQEITTIEKQFRVLAEWELFVVSSDHIPLGPIGKFPFKFFLLSQRDAQNGVLIKKSARFYDKRYFRLYGSFTFLDEEMNALADKAVKIPPYPLQRVSLLRWAFEGFSRPIVATFKKPSPCAS